jgi:predicted GIY-YIG superfamily endonuclease
VPLELPNLPQGWCCYLLLCEDGSYYCGLTGDLKQRVLDHTSAKGSKYTRGIKPKALVWFENHPSRERAARREREIKKWGRTKKEILARSGVWVSLVRHPADSG